MGTMERILRLMADKRASDVYLSAHAPAMIKINGQTLPINNQLLPPDAPRALLAEVLPAHRMEELDATGELNMAHAVEGAGNYRFSAMRQRGTIAAVVRYIASEIPALSTLQVPMILADLILEKRGLLLMVGATGSGKSTTLAAMINYRNESSSDHIITIEDPIEFLHSNKKSIINQREVGLDTKSYARALKSAMRAAPDMLLIGEIRDRETMESAIMLAGTGHLVLATLHANNAAETLDRCINMFPLDQHTQIFLDLSQYLRAILSQRLIIAKDGKRLAAVEVMLNTPYITELVKKGDVSAIKEAIVASSERGVQSFDVALLNLYKQNRIDLEEALANADSRSNLEAKINFG